MSKKMAYNEFLELARKKHNDFYIYDDETKKSFNGSHSVIPIICPKHGRFYVMAKNHLKYKCRDCSYEERSLMMRSSTEEFIEKARKVHGDKYDYSKVEYKTAKNDDICIICPNHGEFFMKPNYHLSGEGCPRCKDSHLERSLSNALDGESIDYERGKHFDWLGKQELDFYIGSLGVGIECQGKQHFGLGGWSGNFDFEKLFELDERKNRLCKDNGIKLIYLADKRFCEVSNKFGMYNNCIFFNVNDLVEYVKEIKSK